LKQGMLGQKIKALRLKKGMTQTALAGETITRNMLSQIENGSAQPSVATITELAEKLEAPMEYFFSEIDDIDVFRKISAIDRIRKAYSAEDYGRCIYRLDRLGVSDEETEYLYATAFFGKATDFYREGRLKAAQEHFEQALVHAKKTPYIRDGFLHAAHRYLEAIRFIRDKEEITEAQEFSQDVINYRADLDYVAALTQVSGAAFSTESGTPYDRHLSIHERMQGQISSDEAAALMKELRGILDGLDAKRYAVLRYYALCDLEALAQRTEDYKCAYECASERLAISEKMNT